MLIMSCVSLLNRINDFSVSGSFGSFESLSIRLADTPLAGLAAFLALSGQRLGWVLPPGGSYHDLQAVFQK